jgi:ABC-type glycerol-3-phosphate transport system permease component
MFDKFPTIYYAALFISMVPVIVVFAIFAEQIMKNMSVGGLKG